jgi:hypothetical protein
VDKLNEAASLAAEIVLALQDKSAEWGRTPPIPPPFSEFR